MDCSYPPPLTEDELSAALDGEASAEVQRHLELCDYCSNRLAAARVLEQRLNTTLRRFDCPPSQAIVDYDAGLLDSGTRAAVQQHVEMCSRCQGELNTLRRFLNDEDAAAPTLQVVQGNRPRPQERIAQPRVDTGAWAARGLQDGSAHDWEVDGATIFLELNHRAEGLVLSGQVVDEAPLWNGALAELRQSGAVRGVSVLDDIGEFRFVLNEQTPASLHITSQSGITLVLENIALTD